MTIETFKKEVESIWKKHFPYSRIVVGNKCSIYKNITIRGFIAKDRLESLNGYLDNDMVSFVFYIEGIGGELESLDPNFVLDDITLEKHSYSYHIKPIYNKYNCYDSIHLKARKTKGNVNKIIQKLEQYIITLKESLKDSLRDDIIHDKHLELLKNKLCII